MTIYEAISAARRAIDEAARAAGRTDRVALELAAKTRTPGECYEAAACLARLGGPVLVGHNRVQEARATAEAVRRVDGARIHLIGPLQSNKINQALACVDAVETVSSAELARRIDARATRPLPVFVQVNVSGEATKSGCAPDAVAPVVDAVSECANLRLAGFMTVGLNSTDEAPVRRAYARLRSIRDGAAARTGIGAASLELSMGMSRDMAWAIAEGATIVRLGTAVFGARPSASPHPPEPDGTRTRTGWEAH